jgi:flagellar protein FliL
MTEAVETAEPPSAGKKKGKLGLILGLVAALALGGGGFYAVYAGLVDPTALLGAGGHGGGGGHGEAAAVSLPGDIAFVAMEPIMVSLPPGSSARHLRFTGQLEVSPEQAAEVAALMPRVLDVLNTYLRAVEVRDLEDPSALARLRAQMLRGAGRDRRGQGAGPARHRIRAELGASTWIS